MAAPKKAASGKQPPISIKPENEGKLRATTKTKKGDTIPVEKLEELKNSPNPTTRKRANFALNARSWGKDGSK